MKTVNSQQGSNEFDSLSLSPKVKFKVLMIPWKLLTLFLPPHMIYNLNLKESIQICNSLFIHWIEELKWMPGFDIRYSCARTRFDCNGSLSSGIDRLDNDICKLWTVQMSLSVNFSIPWITDCDISQIGD